MKKYLARHPIWNNIQVKGSDRVDYLYIHFSGPQVFEATTESGSAVIQCGRDGKVSLHGTQENFNFAPYGIEVKTKVWVNQMADGKRIQRDAWISFPYSSVVTTVRRQL